MGERIFAFSCMNYMSYNIAESVLKNHGSDCRICFFNTDKKPFITENCFAFEESITNYVNMHFEEQESSVIYLCSYDDVENFNDAVFLMKAENIKPCGADLVVFGKYGCFDGIEKKGFRVRRIDGEMLWAMYLFHSFDMSKTIKNDAVCVCIDGFRRDERELVKALSWLLIHEGELLIKVRASQNERLEFEKECPEMLCNEKLNDFDEINYRIEFVKEFSESDRVFNFENSDFSEIYSEKILINDEVELTAQRIFFPWNEMRKSDEKFWQKEFYYSSSTASAMFWLLRKRYGLDLEICEENMRIEHRRWNAYMRSEGYVYGEVRDHDKKTHHCLVRFDELSEEEKSYDINPIRSVK